MFGKTNATTSGGGSSGGTITLLWTNPNTSANFSSITISANNLIGAVIDVKRMSSSSDSAYLRNFCMSGQSNLIAGRDPSNNTFINRTATCTPTSISISTATDNQPSRTIPLRIYGIQ